MRCVRPGCSFSGCLCRKFGHQMLADCCTSSPFLRIARHNSGGEGGGGGEGGVEAEVGAVEEGGEFGETEGEAFGGGGTERNMAEFGAGGFAVEVEVGVRDGEDFGGFGEIADQIEHGAVAGESRGAEREAEDGTEVILKLAGDGPFDGPMTGIVDSRG